MSFQLLAQIPVYDSFGIVSRVAVALFQHNDTCNVQLIDPPFVNGFNKSVVEKS